MCGATSCMMKDELIMGKHQVDGTRLLIYLYSYIFIRCINFFAILVSQVRCYCNLYLLSFIVTMYLTNFCMNNIQIVVFFIHYSEGHYFYCIFCVNNWLSFHTLLY